MPGPQAPPPPRAVQRPYHGGPVTLDNFEAALPSMAARFGKVLTSPRSLRVCARFGIPAEDLVPLPRGGGAALAHLPAALRQHRANHAEARRQQRLALLQHERAQLVAVEAERSPSPDAAGPGSPSPVPASSSSSLRGRSPTVTRVHTVAQRRAAHDHARLQHMQHRLGHKDAALDTAAASREERLSGVRRRGGQHADLVLRRATETSNRRAHDAHTAAERLQAKNAEELSRARAAAEDKAVAVLSRGTTARVERVSQLAAELAAERQAAATAKALSHGAHIEAQRERAVRALSEASTRRSSLAGSRREMAYDAAATAAHNRLEARLRVLGARDDAFAARTAARDEERLWRAVQAQMDAADHAEEVRRVARAKAFERAERLEVSIAAKSARAASATPRRARTPPPSLRTEPFDLSPVSPILAGVPAVPNGL